MLTVVDTFSRYAPAIDPRLSYRGEDVVQVLEKVCASPLDKSWGQRHGQPDMQIT